MSHAFSPRARHGPRAFFPPLFPLQILADLAFAGSGGGQMIALLIAITYLTAVVTLTAWIAVFLYAIQEGGLMPRP